MGQPNLAVYKNSSKTKKLVKLLIFVVFIFFYLRDENEFQLYIFVPRELAHCSYIAIHFSLI
jgi:hypothetical protein